MSWECLQAIMMHGINEYLFVVTCKYNPLYFCYCPTNTVQIVQPLTINNAVIDWVDNMGGDFK